MFILPFLIIYLYFLIPAVVAQLSNPIAEIIILIGILSNEAKGEITTQKTRKGSI